MSGADYAGRKTTLVLFINGRAVECSPLKRALEATYASILPKASKPFVYLVSAPLSSRYSCWEPIAILVLPAPHACVSLDHT